MGVGMLVYLKQEFSCIVLCSYFLYSISLFTQCEFVVLRVVLARGLTFCVIQGHLMKPFFSLLGHRLAFSFLSCYIKRKETN